MPVLETTDGEFELVPEEKLGEASRSGRYRGDQTVRMRNPQGDLITAPLAEVERAAAEGARPEAPQRTEKIGREAALEREYGSLGQEVLTGVEGVGRGLTLGASDILGLTSGMGAAERREVNPYLSTGSEIGGAIAPALLSGGATAGASAGRAGGTLARALARTPAGLATRAGESIAARGGIGAAAAGYGLEGAAFGAGEAVSELALSEDPVTLERAAGTIGSGALLGGALGGGIGLAGKAAAKGLRRAKGLADDAASRIRSRKAGEGADVVDDLSAYRQQLDESGAFEAALPESEARAVLSRQNQKLRGILDNPKGFRERPYQAIDALQRHQRAIQETIDNADDILKKASRVEHEASEDIMRQLADGAEEIRLRGAKAQHYGDWRGLQVSKKEANKKKGIKVSEDSARRFVDAYETGALRESRRQSLANMDDLLRRNETLEQGLKDAADAIKQGGKEGLIQKGIREGSERGVWAIGGGLTGGPLGAAVGMAAPKIAEKLTSVVSKRLSKAGTEVAERSASAISAATSAAKKGVAAAPPVASKILSGTSFGADKAAAETTGTGGGSLLDAFRARESELLAQTTTGPDGQPQMRPAARAKVAERLSGVRAVSPLAADRLESSAARRVEFLASKLPKRPDAMARSLGPESWRPSDFQMRQWARYVAAVEDPAGALERISDGTVTPEDREALRAVYPEMYADARDQIVRELSSADKPPPFSKRIALSLFLGAPVDPSMSPEIIRRLQSGFDEEPGTAGGTTPPTPQPQFGSIEKPEPTPSQERATG